MDESNSNLLHYGFSSLDDEIAKDRLDAENAYANGTGGVLQNVDPSVILDITGSAPTESQDIIQRGSQSTALQLPTTDAPVAKPKSAARPRKRKAAKPMKDENAPKLPQTGYVAYMNERRVTIKADNPHITFSELTKTIAAQWSGMDVAVKKRYLDVAEQKKVKYLEELAVYQRTETYKCFQSKKQLAEVSGVSMKAAGDREAASTSQPKAAVPVKMPGMDMPVFTEEFLEHNKSREKELRELRKLNSQYEEQNAILSKHVEDLKSIVSSLDEEANTQRNNNIALIQHLESLRDTLATNFATILLPGVDEVPTVGTIDTYMTKLHKIILDAPQENQDLILAVREVVNKLNLEAYVT